MRWKGVPNSFPRPLLAGLALIIVVAIYAVVQESEIDYGDVTVEQSMKLIERNPDLLILDVRTEMEFEGGHIESAINIPVDELDERLNEIDADDKLLVYYRTGNRSTRAVDILLQNGFSNIYHMVGGIEAWGNAGYPIVR